MKLSELIKNIEHAELIGDGSADIKGVAYDSTSVGNGSCFVALRGERVDSHQFVLQAIKNGAVAVVTDRKVSISGVANVVVSDTRDALAKVSAAFFKYPSSKMRVIGITGTNGKTTITYLIESVLKSLKRKVGVIGTINWRYNGIELPAQNTTPVSYELQRLLSEMKKGRVDDVVMEVSSHALDQRRVECVEFDVGVFTNLTHDHLDYHNGIEDYFKAKSLLFSDFLPRSGKKIKIAVVNSDDPFGRKLIDACRHHAETKAYSFGLNGRPQVFATDINATVEGSRMQVKTPWGDFRCFSRLKGEFNISNLLAAVAVLGALGVKTEDIKSGLKNITSVPGRLEEVTGKKGISIFVDYAHTPDALKNVLETLRKIAKGRIITVFGCGGDRDRKKRPVMGEVAARLSDVVIATSDNPRSENPAKILDELVCGIKKTGLKMFGANGHGYMVEEDRAAAIREALKIASEKDIVLIAGKGHENYQIVGKDVRHFDDREEVLKYL